MPFTVPRVDRVRELPAAPNALPSVRQTAAPTADMLGGNARVPTNHLGAGMASAAKSFGAVAEQIQERQDFDALNRAEVMLRDAVRAKESEWSERRGIRAAGVTKEADAWFTDEAAKIADGLSTDRQRRVFAETVQKHRAASLDAFSRHETQEMRASVAESTEASIVSSIGFAIEHADSPEAIATAARDVDVRVSALAQTLGWSPEKTAIERQRYGSQLHSQVIARLSDGNPDAAADYLQRHEGEIDPVVVTRLRKAVEASTSTRRAQSFADEVMGAGMSEADALAKARRELSGEDEVRAVAEIKTRHAEQSSARERAQRAAADTAYQHYSRGGLNAIPPSVWAELDGRDALNLREFDAKRIDRIAARNSKDPARVAAVEQQERVAYARLRELQFDDPEAFKKVDLIEEGAALRDSDFRQLQKEQAEMRAGKQVDGPVDHALKRATEELGIGGTSEKARKERAELLAAYEKDVARFERENGRKPKASERAEIVERLADAGTVPGLLWGRNESRRYEAVNEGKSFRSRESEAGAGNAGADLPRPTTQAEYDALPKGQRYVHPDGDVRTKK